MDSTRYRASNKDDMKPTRLNKKEVVLILATIIFALGIRIFLLFTYQPLYGNDAPSYAALAEMIRTADFTGYNGVRTPGYPLFMLICGMNNHLIRLAQNVCGVLSIWIIYLLVRPHLSRTAALGLILFMSISIQFPFYEAIIQTESLALLTVISSVYFLVTPSSPPWRNLWLAGMLASIGALIRPHLIFLPALYLVLYCLRNWNDRQTIFGGIIALLLPAIVLIGGWIMFNSSTLSRATFTTIGGYSIIAHMIPYVEDADERFGDLKYAYVKSLKEMKDKVNESDDNRAGYTWYAGRVLRELNYDTDSLDFSDQQNKMTADLIRKHPLGYLKQSMYAWTRFWRVHIIVYEECFGNSNLYTWSMRFWWPIKIIWIIGNALFLFLLPIWPFLQMSSNCKYVIGVVYAILLSASLTQSLTNYFDNARFAIPFQPFVFIPIVLVGLAWFEHRKSVRVENGI